MEKVITISKYNKKILELPDSNERMSIIVEPDSEVTILDNINTDRQIEIFAKENSRISFLSLQNSNKDNIKIKRNATTGKNAIITWLDCHFGGSSCTCETTNLLQGDNSATNNFCLFFGNASQNFDLKINSIHDGRNTTSEILTRGVLDNEAKAKCKGLLQINKFANDSCGYQKSEILLLNKKANVDCVPELNINNNAVKRCTHGATVSQIDAEKLFYFMSRGFTRSDAVKNLVEAFFASLFAKTNNADFNAELQKIIEAKLK